MSEIVESTLMDGDILINLSGIEGEVSTINNERVILVRNAQGKITQRLKIKDIALKNFKKVEKNHVQ